MTQESHSWVFAPNDENYVQTKTYILMLMPDCARALLKAIKR